MFDANKIKDEVIEWLRDWFKKNGKTSDFYQNATHLGWLFLAKIQDICYNIRRYAFYRINLN